MKTKIYTLMNDAGEPIIWMNLEDLLQDLSEQYCGFFEDWKGRKNFTTFKHAEKFVDDNEIGELFEEVQDIRIFTLAMVGSEDDDFSVRVEHFPTLAEAKKYIHDNYTNEGNSGERNEAILEASSVDEINYFLMKECESRDRLFDSEGNN